MQIENLSDERLAQLSQSGDKNATELLLKRYKNVVLSVARRFFLSGGETEDLVQEGMCGLYSAIGGYSEGKCKSGFSAYATRCIRNRIIDAVKATTGAKHSALNNFLPIVEVGEELYSSPQNPEDELIKRENRREFLRKISKDLSSFEFKVTVMYMDGLTMAEISSATGKPVKSIDNALQRAKRKLFKLFN
ncbi:MAG TPA: sigma-70 family RNA polymerase sigma factor [Candidatus Coproplasma stercoripullorum]|uniref:RNA polymerase sigma factor SigS n=1 Tax=Candidatus Coproplasma stercoripullorum TaxID=2840751 RepID=A0A9D1AFT8_9FIRM|nr:sigma-70 family RNA polymerase sigma factor [Candidatus Coproplasma stercoripullorum]